MLETVIHKGIFTIKEIWFANKPYDVEGCDSVVFRACKNKVDIAGFECSEFQTLTIDLAKTEDEIFKNFDKKSCQYQIKRALRDNIRVENVRKLPKIYKEYDELNKSFRDDKGIDNVINYQYLWDYGNLFVAYINGELVAGQIYLEDKDNIRWLLGASKRLEDNNPLIGCANRLLIWEAIKYAKSKGIKEFDFGGYYNGTEKPDWARIGFFKKSFGGDIVNHYIYTKDYSQKYKFAKTLKQLVGR